MNFRKGLFSLVLMLGTVLTSAAMASEGGATTGGNQWGPLAAAIAIAFAAFGGAFGQGRTAAAALEGMARNPQAKLMGPMIVGLALIESLVIYALVIAFKVSG